MERRFLDMQQEISGLKTYISLIQPVAGARDSAHPFAQQHAPYMPQTQPNHYPNFVQGSSNMPLDGPSLHTEERALSTTPMSSGSSSTGVSTARRSAYPRKRPSPPTSTSESESSDGESATSEARPSKRVNGHDSRCLTIQACLMHSTSYNTAS